MAVEGAFGVEHSDHHDHDHHDLHGEQDADGFVGYFNSAPPLDESAGWIVLFGFSLAFVAHVFLILILLRLFGNVQVWLGYWLVVRPFSAHHRQKTNYASAS